MLPMIIPTPTRADSRPGGFVIRPDTVLVAAGDAVGPATVLRELLGPATGLDLRITERESGGGNEIVLSVDRSSTQLGSAGYRLGVDDDGVRVVAAEPAGLCWAVQTVRQLLPPAIYASAVVDGVRWRIPAAEILDIPRFSWRGLMIDLARWFRPVAEVRRLIELAAMHKVNVLHLHLTDDQGWRFECRRYPRLTEIGAWRSRSMVGPADDGVFDDRPHGGFYTQAELRELVGVAARLGVTLVPEIDVPGHMTAAIAAYPELGNDPNRRLSVGDRWGIIEEVLNVEEETVEFITNVLDEVMEVFPSSYIHIGGDECPRVEWAASARAQQRKRELGLSSDDELQAWFIARLAEHLSANGRKLIGWDEILDGGIADDATVMSWRGEDGGIRAARAGHDVVMTPEQEVYLDYYQGDPATEPWAPRGMNTLAGILDFEPVPAVLTAEQATHVLGTQANLWVEYIPTRKQLDYMLFPRLCAVSEVAWGSPVRSPAEFRRRLPEHLRRLDVLGVGYRPPGPQDG